MALDQRLFEQLNSAYAALGRRASALKVALTEAGERASWNWYAYHSTLIDGEYRVEEFPIPVVEVEGLCDIGFHMDEIFVEFRLSFDHAFGFDFGQLPQPFEVYGAEDYFHNFYTDGMDPDGIAARIMGSGEQEVCVSINLPGDTETDVLTALTADCRRWLSKH